MKRNSLLNMKAPEGAGVIRTIDMHTAGEPLRVIIDGLPEIKGKTILEKRKYFKENHDNIRRSLMFEPRGHADMYGAILTEALTEGADFGTFFLHNEGYSTMCGHAVIALTRLAVDSGIVKADGDEVRVEIDAPPGRISATAHMFNGRVKEVSFRNVPSFLLMEDEWVVVPGIGKVRFDVAYGGAFYAFCDAKELGLQLDNSDYQKLIDYGRRIKKAVSENFRIRHPLEDDLSFLYGTIFTGSPYDHNNWSRNVCIFAEGEVDRSPTGSGVSARAALHFAKREIGLNDRVTVESILGTTMTFAAVEKLDYEGYPAVIPEVSGEAYYTGSHNFWLDSKDPLIDGFIFR